MPALGLVSDIQRYSLHDGPGIRTVIFLKSCPLTCQWCANPEAQKPHPELMLTNTTCVACEECVSACPNHAITLIPSPDQGIVPVIDWASCDASLACVSVCPTGTLTQVGQVYTVDEIARIISLDHDFYERSKGGVTLSGGEPTAQPAFSRAILEACQDRSIHTAIETCGACEWDQLLELMEFVDLIYFDLKHLDSNQHKHATGVPNDQILKNLAQLVHQDTDWVIRLPLIPGFNDSDDHLTHIANHLLVLDSELELELVPFHRLGTPKYPRLGRRYFYEEVTPVESSYLIDRKAFLEERGMRVR